MRLHPTAAENDLVNVHRRQYKVSIAAYSRETQMPACQKCTMAVITIICLERDAWSMVEQPRHVSNEYVCPLKKDSVTIGGSTCLTVFSRRYFFPQFFLQITRGENETQDMVLGIKF